MKLPKPAPEAPDTLEQRTTELAAVRAEIATAEAALPDLALDDDDSKFEETTLRIDRLKRAELRAVKRLEGAREALDKAKASEEQDSCKALHEAGLTAHAEGERLLEQYATKAEEIVAILRKLDKLGAPIDAANKYLPEGEREIDWYELTRLCESVVLPASTCGDKDFWWRSTEWTAGPLDPPQGRTWQPPSLAELPPPAPRSEEPAGQRTLEKGGRAFVMPPCDFGSAAR